MTKGHVSEGKKHPLLVIAKCYMETSRNLVIWSKSIIRSNSVTRLRFIEMSDQWRVSQYMVMLQNVVIFERETS